LREAPDLAAAIRDVLAKRLPVGETAEAVWGALWPAEKRRQVRVATPCRFRNNPRFSGHH